jgi:hypothetical protein
MEVSVGGTVSGSGSNGAVAPAGSSCTEFSADGAPGSAAQEKKKNTEVMQKQTKGCGFITGKYIITEFIGVWILKRNLIIKLGGVY